MRVSADPSDVGYREGVAQFLTVLRNGQRVDHVITADTDIGYLRRYLVAEGDKEFLERLRSGEQIPGVVGFDADTRTVEEDVKDLEILLDVSKAEFLATPLYTRTANWLRAYGKGPSPENLTTQVGCHLEEVAEFVTQLVFQTDDVRRIRDTAFASLQRLGNLLKSREVPAEFLDREKALDALCDSDVTGNGVAYFAGFNKIRADQKVLKANDMKLAKGPVILPGGKIGKPEGWVPADLSDCV